MQRPMLRPERERRHLAPVSECVVLRVQQPELLCCQSRVNTLSTDACWGVLVLIGVVIADDGLCASTVPGEIPERRWLVLRFGMHFRI